MRIDLYVNQMLLPLNDITVLLQYVFADFTPVVIHDRIAIQASKIYINAWCNKYKVDKSGLAGYICCFKLSRPTC